MEPINPVNTLLILPITYLLYRIIYPSLPVDGFSRTYDANIYNWLPEKHPDVLVQKKYTPTTLAPFDGKTGGRILLAIMKAPGGKLVSGGKGERTVFDVSSGRSFYGPGKQSCPAGLILPMQCEILKRQMECMGTSLVKTPREAWQSSRMMMVSLSPHRSPVHLRPFLPANHRVAKLMTLQTCSRPWVNHWINWTI
jgi:hypothetical protein